MDARLAQPAVATVTAPGEDPAAFARLRAVVLLAGSVRPSQLSRGIGRSLLDLPVDEATSVGSLWHTHGADLAERAGLPALPLRILIDREGAEPRLPALNGGVEFRVERDQNELRGTAGVLRDAAMDYARDDLVLVANGAQVLVEPLAELAADLIATRADVALLAHQDGTPVGIFLVSCAVLDGIRDVGFLDFKEQVLPKLAASGRRIAVVRRAHATGYPVRTLDGYLSGLRAWRHRRSGVPGASDPFREDWSPSFSIQQKGAAVDASATIHDSVVLDGGRVERNAVVVRSVVCPGGVVRAGEIVADQIVGRGREDRGAVA
jgi:NDP-sugar pyrophosphorylase family protein